jgi:large subunit ribosomal protein L10
MSKPVKDLITRDYQESYRDVDSACVISVVGLDAVSTNRLRGELLAKNVRLRVVKNSLARRAFADSPLAPLGDALEGPCSLVTADESAIDIAKLLVECKKKYPQIELKRGILDGDPELLDVEQLAKMKSRLELLGELAMLLTSPGRAIAGCLSGPGGRIAGCLKAMVEKEGAAEA